MLELDDRAMTIRGGRCMKQRCSSGVIVQRLRETLLIQTIVASTALVAGLSASSEVRCSFPGGAHECQAPGSQSTIEWREPAGKGPHELWLRDAAKPPAKLLEFDRRVDVLWAPDARTLAITDHEGSDSAVVWIVRTGSPGMRVNIEDGFVRSVGKGHPVYKHGHRYFTARSWSSATTLVFDVRGHDAAPGEEYRGVFTYDVSGRVHQNR